MRNLKRVVTLLALAGIAACGGPQTPPPAGPPTGPTEEVKEAPKRQITKAEAQDFASAAKRYNSYLAAAKKGGGWSKGDCKSAADAPIKPHKTGMMLPRNRPPMMLFVRSTADLTRCRCLGRRRPVPSLPES